MIGEFEIIARYFSRPTSDADVTLGIGDDAAVLKVDGHLAVTVDTLVAQHLLKTVAAARLMGADCIISGIRPQIAQTIVHLGLDLSEVTTKSSLADAVVVALERTGYEITRRRTAIA